MGVMQYGEMNQTRRLGKRLETRGLEIKSLEHEEHKARRGVKKAKVPAYKVSEGKTFDAWKKAAASALGRKKEERKPQKAQDAGARAKRLLQRKEYASKVSGSTENVPDEMRD